MEESKQPENTIQEGKTVEDKVTPQPKRVVAVRKPIVKKPIVKAESEAVHAPIEANASIEISKTESQSNDDADQADKFVDVDTQKLGKKNLKKLKQMSDKIKEKEKKTKEKQKEKEKKAKKKKKEKAKKEKAKKKLKEKKAKKKAAAKKKKSKKK